MKAFQLALILALSSLNVSSLYAQQQSPPAAPPKTASAGSFNLDTDVPYFATLFGRGGIYSAAGEQANSTQLGFEAGAEDFGRKVGWVEFAELGAIGPLVDRNSPRPSRALIMGRCFG